MAREVSMTPTPTPTLAVRGLLLLGVVFHAAYVLSIFDIYFTSPVVPHVASLAYTDASSSSSSSPPPPARRVVVFVADGCRADALFERNATDQTVSHTSKPQQEQRVSFLRDVIESRGSWGVSHTRVPTESRPGHVALFAGMYEDVSAVTKGWQENPVDFDSVFNQSRASWLFGSPDIVPMLAHHVPQAVEAHYSHEEEDFASSDASRLDTWVYNRLTQMLEHDARHDDALDAALRQDQVVFFCHFLGIDTNGHAHRPQSHEYLDNVALVDELVERTSRVIEEFYDHDGATAFVFTADHGMSRKGAHGDGDPANTRTPLVAWGAGVAPPQRIEPTMDKDTDAGEHERGGFQIELPTQSRTQVEAQLNAQRVQEALALRTWDLDHMTRKDVMQADVAPLLSALLGLPFPRNSVGVLPFTYLARGAYRTRAVMANARQLVAHAQRKEMERDARALLWFTPFPAFRDELPTLLQRMQLDFENQRFDEAEALSQDVMAICLDTLTYLQRYDWFFLLSVIVLGYTGWMGVLAVVLLLPSRPLSSSSPHQQLPRAMFSVRMLFQEALASPQFLLLAFAVMAFLAMEHSPWSYFVYASFPLLYWNFVWSQRYILLTLNRNSNGSTKYRDDLHRGGSWWGRLLWVIGCLELVVLGYTQRWVFGVVFAVLAVWPFVDRVESDGADSSTTSKAWAASCLVLSVFPLLPSEYGEHTSLVHVGGVVLLILTAWATTTAKKNSLAGLHLNHENSYSPYIQWFVPRCLPLIASMITVQITMYFLETKQRPPTLLTVANWMLALLPIAALAIRVSHRSEVPLKSSTSLVASSPTVRLVEVALALAPAFTLLSISYEVLFFAALTAVLLCWLHVESVRARRTMSSVEYWGEVRRAFFFLLFIKIAFFGTGNVASMSSFELSSTYRFLTVFSPFLMGALLVIKILLPFLLVACAFQLLINSTASSSSRSAAALSSRAFLLVVGMSDLLALHFLFLVQNEGSWKEIGNSISMFGIVNAQIVFVPVLFFLAGRFARLPTAASKHLDLNKTL